MLQIKNLTITHKKDLRVILKDFCLVLNPGDKAVIVGEEGNGKSTLLKWIWDPESIETYTEAEGERILTRERLAYLPQELPKADSSKTIYEYFSEIPSFWEASPKELGQMAGRLHLARDIFYSEQKLGELSGGEKIKIQMLRILLTEPTVLLLDEPSNDIDLETLLWLEQLIVQWEGTVLFISHDETLIERTANVVIHLEQLRRKTESRYTVARVTYEEYVENRLSAMEKQRREAANEKREAAIRQEKFQRIQQSVEYAQNVITRQNPSKGRLLKKKMKAVKSLEKRFEREAEHQTRMPETEEPMFVQFGEEIHIPAGKMVLELKLPELTIGTGRILARNLRLVVRGNEKICIMGCNGAGKSTLIKLVADQLLSRTDIHAAYMPQNYEEQMSMEQTPVEYLTASGDKEEETRIRTYLGSMKYTIQEMERPVKELSGGQKAKLYLLKMSMSQADVLILDEPTRNFSPLSNPVIRQVLKNFGGAVISVSHDRKYMNEVCQTVYELTEEGLTVYREENI